MKNAAPNPMHTHGWADGLTSRNRTAAGSRNNRKYAKVLKIIRALTRLRISEPPNGANGAKTLVRAREQPRGQEERMEDGVMGPDKETLIKKRGPGAKDHRPSPGAGCTQHHARSRPKFI